MSQYMEGLKTSAQLPGGGLTGWGSGDAGTFRGEVRVAGMGEGSSGHGEKLMALEGNLIEIQGLSQFNCIKKEYNSTQDSLVN